MPTVEERLTILEAQMTKTVTRTQVQALMDAQAVDLQTLNTIVQELQALVNSLVSVIQSLKTQVADHENRIDDLETP